MPRCRGGQGGPYIRGGGRRGCRTRGGRGCDRRTINQITNELLPTTQPQSLSNSTDLLINSTDPEPLSSSTEPQLMTSSTEPKPSTSLTEPQPSTSSIENTTLSSQLTIVRKNRALYKKRTTALKPEDKKRLFEMKRRKEVNFMIMPDAPVPKKNKRRLSPDRVPCALVPGTPTVPPERVSLPWTRVSALNTQQQMHVTPPVSLREPLSTIQNTSIVPAIPSESVLNCEEVVDENMQVMNVEYVYLSQDMEEVTLPRTDYATENDVLANLFGEVSIENPGSDIELDTEDSGDFFAVNSRHNVFPAEFPEDADPTHVNQLMRIDAQNDALIQQLLPPDALVFDWKKESSVFNGVREQFTAVSGPTFPVSELETPLQALQKIWDETIIAQIVEETNKYARSFPNSDKFWKDVTLPEMWTFLSILIIQGLNPKPVEREYWYSNLPYTNMPLFRKIMPYKRFIMLKRFLHFSDNRNMDPRASTHKIKLQKIQPVIDHLSDKFRSLYCPDQLISVDESLLLWKSRLNFSQKIANKAAQVGIKSYEICESKSGYLWNFIIYTGKSTSNSSATDHTYGTDENFPDGATAGIVYDLTRPLFNKGYTLIMDNFYNSPLLSRSLKVLHKTDTMGTLRLNREFVPDSLKKITKTEMRVGEIAFSQTHDLTVLVWRDSNLVSMISTYHNVEVGGKEKHGQYKYRPKVILDYNNAMGGVDKKDQLLSAFPMERTRNSVWYKKLFRRLFNVSIMNANIIFNYGPSPLKPRQFREELVIAILSQYRGPMPHQIAQRIEVVPSNENNLSACRPQLTGGHYPERGASSRARCKWCAEKKIVSRTTWRCDVCKVALCIEFCFKQYHT